MLERKKLKKNARGALKHQYFKAVILCFIFTVCLSGNNTLVSNVVSPIQENNYVYAKIIKDNNIGLDKKEKKKKKVVSNKKAKEAQIKKNTRGILSIFANQISTTGSLTLGILMAFNNMMFHGSVSEILLISLGALINFFFLIFVKNILAVGKCRYFLENRKYKKTNFDKLLLVYRVRRSLNVAKGMLLVSIYQFLWDLTIVGGFIKHYSYRLVPYILAENPSIKARDAIRLSKEMMHGYKWYAFKVDISLLPWFLLGMFTFQFVDILFLNPYYETILAELYMEVRKRKKKEKIENITLLNDTYLEGEVVNDSYPMDKFSIPRREYREWLHINYKRDYTMKTYILLFFTFSIAGWIWEVSLHLFSDGIFVNRGTLLGPWLPIYGWGGVLILILLKPFRNKPWLTFLLAALICGTIEYGTAWYLETFKHMRWWDYTGYFLNIDGRVCLEGLLFFGLGGCGFTYIAAPILDNLYRKISLPIQSIACIVLILFFLIDNIYSHKHPNTGHGITDYQTYQDTYTIKERMIYNV